MGKIQDLLKNDVEIQNVTNEAFEAVDSDQSGYVDEKELGVLMAKVACDCGVDKPKSEDVHNALIAMDTNHDGKISREEFKVLVIEILKTLAAAEQSDEDETN